DLGGGVVDVALAAGVGVRVQALGVGLHLLEERLQVALDAQLLLHLLQFGTQARDLRQAQFVDLVGGHVGGGVLAQLVGVVRRTVRMGLAHAGGIGQRVAQLDRKSTRLNSSHVKTSYAV